LIVPAPEPVFSRRQQRVHVFTVGSRTEATIFQIVVADFQPLVPCSNFVEES
jgi:hypothetical protein